MKTVERSSGEIPERNQKTIAATFAAALTEMPSPALDRVNTRFGQKYATIGSYLETCRPHLALFGLSLASDFEPMADGNLLCVTVIRNGNGDELRLAPIPVRVDLSQPQSTGSAITYARRYSISSALGVVGIEDDDANAASPEPETRSPKFAPRPVAPSTPQKAPPAPAPQLASKVSVPEAIAKSVSSRLREESEKQEQVKAKSSPAGGEFAAVRGFVPGASHLWRSVRVIRVGEKSGETKGRPWVRFSVLVNDGEQELWLSTFDDKVAELARKLKDRDAEIVSKESRGGLDLEAIREPVEAVDTGTNQNTDTEVSDDDIPF